MENHCKKRNLEIITDNLYILGIPSDTDFYPAESMESFLYSESEIVSFLNQGMISKYMNTSKEYILPTNEIKNNQKKVNHTIDEILWNVIADYIIFSKDQRTVSLVRKKPKYMECVFLKYPKKKDFLF